MFDPTSRYYRIPTAALELPGDNRILYMKRRLIPLKQGTTLSQESVRANDRLDLIAARVFGDPALFWRICDANEALSPFDLLTTTGRTLVIPSPEISS